MLKRNIILKFKKVYNNKIYKINKITILKNFKIY